MEIQKWMEMTKKNEWIKKLQFVTIEIANRKCFFLVKMWTTNA